MLDTPFPSIENSGEASKEISLSSKKKKVAMPEEVKTKLVNQTAFKAAGGRLKSWMIPGGGAGSGTPSVGGSKKESGLKAVPVKKTVPHYEPKGFTSKGKETKLNRPMTHKELRRVILKDALLCMDKERGISQNVKTKWWMNIK